MMRWPNGRPRMWYGFADFGPIQFPTVPRFIILTDRADGSLWWLTYNTAETSSDDYGYISITSTSPPDNQEHITYGPYDGPYIESLTGMGMLMVRGGYLGVDEITQQGIEDAESMQIYARKSGLNIPMRHIILSKSLSTDFDGTPSYGWYAWVPYTRVQTPNPT